MAKYSHDDGGKLASEKSEETFSGWSRYWQSVQRTKSAAGILEVTEGYKIDWKSNAMKLASDNGRWYLALRHGERVDLTYGPWVPHCFDDASRYVRKDLNMPLALGDRAGGKESYHKDTPLTRIGQYQARLVGEGLRLAGVTLRHVYSSAALRCVETAHALLEGLQPDPSVKIRVEPGLFEYKHWYMAKGMAPFMTPEELHKAGYNVDLAYKPYIGLDITTSETVEEFYKRGEKVMQSAVQDTEIQGGNIMFVGHAATLDMMVVALKRLGGVGGSEPYKIRDSLLRVPYCALGAVHDRPWRVVAPPCPPSINSSSGRYDWKMLLNVE